MLVGMMNKMMMQLLLKKLFAMKAVAMLMLV